MGFKWCLKERMFSHSRVSAGSEFQMDGAASFLPFTLQPTLDNRTCHSFGDRIFAVADPCA